MRLSQPSKIGLSTANLQMPCRCLIRNIESFVSPGLKCNFCSRRIERMWEEAPLDVLQQITGLLDLRDLQAARMVCRQWQAGMAMGVTKLRPRMEANAVGLQWTELHKLQATFPVIRELDLLQMPPRPCHGPCFAALTSLRRIYISSLQRSSDPQVMVAEVRDFALAVQDCHPDLTIDLELRLGSPVQISSAPSGGNSDGDSIKSLISFPSNVEVTSFSLPALCFPISAQAYQCVMGLTQLHHLRLVSYVTSITDEDFACLSGLQHLRTLSFGVVTNVTDKGLLKGLGKLTDLQELCLYDTKSMTDLGFEGMAENLECLKTLSLSKCHRLTNGGLASLAKLPMLDSLFLSENELITCEGADHFHKGIRTLVVRQCPHVTRSDILI